MFILKLVLKAVCYFHLQVNHHTKPLKGAIMKSSLCCSVLLMSLAVTGAQLPDLFEGEQVIFPSSVRGSQMFSAVIVTKNKHIIVFDGGWREDNANLIKIVKEFSDTIDLWCITHAHSDHFWQLAEFIEKTPDALKVKKLCYNFLSEEWIQEANKHEKSCYEEAMTTIRPLKTSSIPQQITKAGDVFEVDGVKVEVLNDPYSTITGNPINNASVVYNVSIGNKKMLVTGDLGIEGGNRLLELCPDKLKADIVVLAHHGQNGVNKAFYEAVHPSIAIWPTPRWLWENDNGGGPGSGPWRTNYVKCWMQDLGVKRQYNTIKEVRLK